MANTQAPGRLAVTIKETYLQLKNMVDAQHAGTKLSVGARVQANNQNEIIVTHTGHDAQMMRGTAIKHSHNLSIICFSKSYVSASELADDVFGHFSTQNTINPSLLPDVDIVYYPEGQNMYYTDEDDFAVAVTVRAIVTDKTNI